MRERVSASEVGKAIAEHREHATAEHAQRDRWVAIVEAVLLSVVASLVAWSGYSAAKWGTESSTCACERLLDADQSQPRPDPSQPNPHTGQVTSNVAETAYAATTPDLFRLALRRLRPG